MAGSRLKGKWARRTAQQVDQQAAQQAEKRRQLKTLQSLFYQLLLWGSWISIYLGWMPDDETSWLIRKAVLATPILLYVGPLLFCVISDLVIDWTRKHAWSLVVCLWAPWLLSILVRARFYMVSMC
jgi:hypothetical protein